MGQADLERETPRGTGPIPFELEVTVELTDEVLVSSPEETIRVSVTVTGTETVRVRVLSPFESIELADDRVRPTRRDSASSRSIPLESRSIPK